MQNNIILYLKLLYLSTDAHNIMRRIFIIVLGLIFGGSVHVYTFPTGAPSAACDSLTPGHGGTPQSSPSPYTFNLSVFDLYSDGNFYYEPGNIYQCMLTLLSVVNCKAQ